MQRDPAWYAARLGKVTASKVADVVAKTKTSWGASRANYMADLIVERLTGVPTVSFMNQAMQWGIDQEAPARDAYSFYRSADVELVDFVDHPSLSWSGASPDGLVGADGLLEIKCPNSATHIDTLLGEPIAGKYVMQMQWQMACTGRKWCDFASFDPRLPEDMRLFVKRVERDDWQISALEKEVGVFLKELENKLAALKGRSFGEAA